jgi:hypothetical protein
MRKRGFTTVYVSKVIGVHHSTVSRWRKLGYCSKLRTPQALAYLLGLSLDDLAPPDAR